MKPCDDDLPGRIRVGKVAEIDDLFPLSYSTRANTQQERSCILGTPEALMTNLSCCLNVLRAAYCVIIRIDEHTGGQSSLSSMEWRNMVWGTWLLRISDRSSSIHSSFIYIKTFQRSTYHNSSYSRSRRPWGHSERSVGKRLWETLGCLPWSTPWAMRMLLCIILWITLLSIMEIILFFLLLTILGNQTVLRGNLIILRQSRGLLLSSYINLNWRLLQKKTCTLNLRIWHNQSMFIWSHTLMNKCILFDERRYNSKVISKPPSSLSMSSIESSMGWRSFWQWRLSVTVFICVHGCRKQEKKCFMHS